MSEPLVWLLACLALYAAYCVYCGVACGRAAASPRSFFLADCDLPAWVFVLAGTGASVSGWIVLGHPDIVARDGLPFAGTALGAITIPLAGVLFLKRQWMLGKRYGYVTPAEMLGDYYGGETIRILVLLIALVFARALRRDADRRLGIADRHAVGRRHRTFARDVGAERHPVRLRLHRRPAGRGRGGQPAGTAHGGRTRHARGLRLLAGRRLRRLQRRPRQIGRRRAGPPCPAADPRRDAVLGRAGPRGAGGQRLDHDHDPQLRPRPDGPCSWRRASPCWPSPAAARRGSKPSRPGRQPA